MYLLTRQHFVKLLIVGEGHICVRRVDRDAIEAIGDAAQHTCRHVHHLISEKNHTIFSQTHKTSHISAAFCGRDSRSFEVQLYGEKRERAIRAAHGDETGQFDEFIYTQNDDEIAPTMRVKMMIMLCCHRRRVDLI